MLKLKNPKNIAKDSSLQEKTKRKKTTTVHLWVVN
jgi:hypothetical protein